jgi:hypothetical protein
MAVGSIVARILTQYSDKGSKAAQKDIAKLGKNIDAFAKKSAKAFGVAAVASAALAVKIGKDAVQGAMEDQKQQIALATALRNTTGATDEAFAATVTYLDKLELLVGVDNNQLIPSLQILTQATKDVTAAQQLQNLALDISAGTTKDLGAVSLALAKAIGGNVGALTRLGVPLDADAVKAKDLDAILKSLSATFKGQAEKRAQTLEFRLMKLDLAFKQVLDKLGYALIPVLEKFAEVVTAKILPAVNEFVELNQKKLAASFAVAAEFAIILLGAAVNFGNWIANNMGLVKGMATLIAGMFVVGRLAAFITALTAITTALTVLRNTAIAAGIATAFATGGVSVGTAVTALAAVGATALVTKNLFNIMRGNAPAGASTGTKGGSRGNANNVEFDMSRFSGGTSALDKFIAGLDNATKSTKAAKTLQDRINAEAVRKNLARQATLSGSSTIAIGGSGSLPYGNKGTNVTVNVAGSVSTQEDLVTSIVNGMERTSRRNSGFNYGYVGGTKFATR